MHIGMLYYLYLSYLPNFLAKVQFRRCQQFTVSVHVRQTTVIIEDVFKLSVLGSLILKYEFLSLIFISICVSIMHS